MDLSPALCSHFLDICREALGNVILSVREQRGEMGSGQCFSPETFACLVRLKLVVSLVDHLLLLL